MLTDLTLHMMIPTYHMAKSSGCVSNELVWIVALASSSTIRNKSLFYQKIELTLTLAGWPRKAVAVLAAVVCPEGSASQYGMGKG